MAQQHPAAIRALETQAAQEAARPLAQALAAAQQDANRQWVRATRLETGMDPGTLERLLAAIKRLLTTAFRGQAAQARKTVERAAYNGAMLGARQAASIAAAATGLPRPTDTPGAIGPQAQAAVDHIPTAINEEHQHALALLTTATAGAFGGALISGVFNRARRAVTRIARSVAVAVTSAVAAGAAAVARALGPTTRLLWVAEPGACAACVAYAGHSIRPGQLFPGGLTLDPSRTVFPDPIPGPPRHPHCRCDLIPWRAEWHTGGTPLPDLLRARARRGGA